MILAYFYVRKKLCNVIQLQSILYDNFVDIYVDFVISMIKCDNWMSVKLF